MEKAVFEHYKWVFRGKQRKIIIQALDKPKTPTQIQEETGIKVTNASDVLRAMQDKGLVRCINPEDKLGRFYELTKLGEKVKDEFLPK